MRILFLILFLVVVSLPLAAQPLRDINFSYLYNNSTEFSLEYRIYGSGRERILYFEFTSTHPSRSTNEYSIAWELRKTISDKEGKELPEPTWLTSAPAKKTGQLLLDTTALGQLAVAKIIYSAARKVWYYYTAVQQNPPYALLQNSVPVTNTFVRLHEPVSVTGFAPAKQLIVSRYDTDFPAAAPPFSTAQARVSKTISPDSLFTVQPDQPVIFFKKGLYLIQQDTASANGLAFRVEDDYPKLGKIETLAGPLIYVCEKKEMDKLRAAKGDKLLFDKTIIGITGSTERAKLFMRNYFRRVEQANLFFSSFKEGWKTDRGMMYIIYGPPDEVYLLGDREVWEYKNNFYRGRFIFTRAPTLFDPRNFVLLRDKKFTDTWYEMVDLWRKARF